MKKLCFILAVLAVSACSSTCTCPKYPATTIVAPPNSTTYVSPQNSAQ